MTSFPVKLQFISLSLLLYVSYVTSYPSGAPNSACGTLTPLHSGTQPRGDTSPFTVTLSKNTYTPGELITVQLRAPQFQDRTLFIGFLAQVRSADGISQDSVGLFEELPAGTRKACQGASVTHERSAIRNTEVTLKWRAPTNATADLMFRVTFLQQFNRYWVGVSSEVLKFSPTTTTVSTLPTTTASTTTNFTTASTTTTTIVSTTISTTTISPTSTLPTTKRTTTPPTTSTTTTTTTTTTPTTRVAENIKSSTSSATVTTSAVKATTRTTRKDTSSTPKLTIQDKWADNGATNQYSLTFIVCASIVLVIRFLKS